MISATVVGNLGRDAEVIDSVGGPILKFSIASNGRRKEGNDWVKFTTWVNVAMFGERGTKIKDFLVKGKTVAVRGDLTMREYESKGEKKTSLDLKADDVELLGGRDEGGESTGGGGRGGGSGGSRRPSPPAESRAPAAPSDSAGGGDDDLPFATCGVNDGREPWHRA